MPDASGDLKRGEIDEDIEWRLRAPFSVAHKGSAAEFDLSVMSVSE